jgi:hypothetical protein
LVSAFGTDLRENLWRLSTTENWPLLEMQRERLSLEEVFRVLTQETGDTAAKQKV